uniref:MAM and LDL-receptor class A domain-containing protein C10orf112-like n=1 Tax=Saccoglossus kowalevskii TaxID=10224 RepID=A0ABM0M1X3_SACKO|nr:PREDICTED: MAM and LDL-receptor class A domain-containing protein C10orf112-like [Saccoglossus kowalevskii]
MCGLTNDDGNQGNWERNHGNTGTSGTGPSRDHTLGSLDGSYMYADFLNPQGNKKAEIMISNLLKTDVNGRCMQFWYFTSGISIGTLNIYVDYGSMPPGKQLYWTTGGSPTGEWRKASIPVVSPVVHTVRVEAVAEKTTSGIVVIDDIRFTTGWCHVHPSFAEAPSVSLPPPTPDPAELGQNYCDFENDLCNWSQNVKNDDFDWERVNASSVSNGPSTDHTYQRDGQGAYLYIGTSSSSLGMASLESRMMGATNQSCIVFWYHMYGTNVPRLNVYVRNKTNQALPQPIWTRSDGDLNKWKYASIDLKSANGFQIIISGSRLNSSRGFIALDDVRVMDGLCPLPQYHSQSCDFEANNWCDWENGQDNDVSWERGSGSTVAYSIAPSTDHTTRTKAGHYLYLDNSKQTEGDVSYLTSANLRWRGSSLKKCLNMYLYFLGNTGVYSSYIELTYDGSTYQILVDGPVHLDLGDTWVIAGVQYSFYEFPGGSVRFAIKIEAGASSTARTIVAVDDAYVTDGPCRYNTHVDFEYGFGFFFNVYDKEADDFEWILGNGHNKFGLTGPTVDHTFGRTEGSYALFDVSGGSSGQKARLEARPFLKARCVEFWYHMYGNHIGNLSVYIQNDGRAPEILIWSLAGQQNEANEWKQGRFGYMDGQRFIRAITIEATRGDGVRGDIAIDDVAIEEEYCEGVIPTEAGQGRSKPSVAENAESDNVTGIVVGVTVAIVIIAVVLGISVIVYKNRDSPKLSRAITSVTGHVRFNRNDEDNVKLEEIVLESTSTYPESEPEPEPEPEPT